MMSRYPDLRRQPRRQYGEEERVRGAHHSAVHPHQSDALAGQDIYAGRALRLRLRYQ